MPTYGVGLTHLCIWVLGGTCYGSGLMSHAFYIKNLPDWDSLANDNYEKTDFT